MRPAAHEATKAGGVTWLTLFMQARDTSPLCPCATDHSSSTWFTSAATLRALASSYKCGPRNRQVLDRLTRYRDIVETSKENWRFSTQA